MKFSALFSFQPSSTKQRVCLILRKLLWFLIDLQVIAFSPSTILRFATEICSLRLVFVVKCNSVDQLPIGSNISWHAWSRGGLGCCAKPSLIISVDEPSKGLRIQGRTVKKTNIAEGFGSASTCEMDNSAIQSQRRVSSVSTSNQALHPNSCPGSTNSPTEFVNHGHLLWNQTRQQWIGNKKSQNHGEVQEPRLSWTANYESLLGTNKPFPKPIPLHEMVDFLVDVWEQEGLYD